MGQAPSRSTRFENGVRVPSVIVSEQVNLIYESSHMVKSKKSTKSLHPNMQGVLPPTKQPYIHPPLASIFKIYISSFEQL